MRYVALAVVLLIALVEPRAASNSSANCEVIDDVINILRTIHAGDARQTLLSDFEEDGGLQNAIHTRYVFKRYRAIKVGVEFDVKPSDKRFESLPTDKIVRLSKPYLEFPSYD